MIIVNILTIEELPFFWIINGNIVNGLKNNQMQKIEIKAEVTQNGQKETIIINPKIFFIINNAIYFSANFNEYVDEETIIHELFFEQIKGKQPAEIEELPSVPESDFYIESNGRYRIEKNRYQELFVSDIFQITTGRFNRNLKVSNYYYGNFQNYTGAFFDVQEKLPNVRNAGLYFWPDNKTSIMQIMPEGRMFNF